MTAGAHLSVQIHRIQVALAVLLASIEDLGTAGAAYALVDANDAALLASIESALHDAADAVSDYVANNRPKPD